MLLELDELDGAADVCAAAERLLRPAYVPARPYVVEVVDLEAERRRRGR